jgi:hypothetical protein
LEAETPKAPFLATLKRCASSWSLAAKSSLSQMTFSTALGFAQEKLGVDASAYRGRIKLINISAKSEINSRSVRAIIIDILSRIETFCIGRKPLAGTTGNLGAPAARGLIRKPGSSSLRCRRA